jgi:hypothetical protein
MHSISKCAALQPAVPAASSKGVHRHGKAMIGVPCITLPLLLPLMAAAAPAATRTCWVLPAHP